MTTDVYALKDGSIQLNFHPGQELVWDSEKRFIVALAGTQGGKTVTGPLWLWREMQRCGPGDYLVVGPTLRLLERKSIPEFLRFFVRVLDLGKYTGIPRYEFLLSEEGSIKMFGEYDELNPTRVMFGYAENPDSLESATAKGIWCDESGQNKFREDSWDALVRRASINQARILHTTTPYNFGWLKRRLHDPWKRAPLLHTIKIPYTRDGKEFFFYHQVRDHKDIEVIRFESRLNPAFPLEEWYRAREDMPAWKFGLFYRAMFTRPAGMIYDCFSNTLNTCEPFPIPEDWERFVGTDFGGRNTAAVFIARPPKGKEYYLYRTYHAGGRTAKEHAAELLKGEPRVPRAWGGAPSENQWRDEFTAAGFAINRPLFDGGDSVAVGIERVYAAFATGNLKIFNTCTELLDEIESYSYEIDDRGEPDPSKIEDKNKYHLLDSLRYVVGGWIGKIGAYSNIEVPTINLSYGAGNTSGNPTNPFSPF